VFHCRHLKYRRAKLRMLFMLALMGSVVGVSFWLTYGLMNEHQAKIAAEGLGGLKSDALESKGKVVRTGALGSFETAMDAEVGQSAVEMNQSQVKVEMNQSANVNAAESSTINADKCQFRTYPPNRLYGLPSSDQPDFLSDAIYIRGQYPVILNPSTDKRSATKLCINTTSWEDLLDSKGNERLPFTDGHNPSIISLKSTPYDDNNHVRIHPNQLEPIKHATQQSLDSLYMAITVFGSGQCKFGLSPQDIETYRFSTLDSVPNGKRAVISIHSSSPFETILQSTLLLERDAKYGTNNRRAIPISKIGDDRYDRIHQEFDDPRFFFHDQRIWVLYRNGPLFGYNDQIHNPLHFEVSSEEDRRNGVPFVVYVKASETVRVCCGRNIALISEESAVGDDGVSSWVEEPKLKALTWVDPVTVVDVNLGDVKLDNRRLDEASFSINLPESNNHSDNNHRRLKSKGPKSHIHGTNGYMVPLSSSGELLGIAHFHRPEDRKSSEYALHGHHYTHVFFTIARSGADGPYKLKRLSNEFMFQAQYSSLDDSKMYQDGDVIQFASGLDLVGSDRDGTLVISYGINDCEGAVFTMSMEKLNQMLIEVQPDQEVVDLMTKVIN
jgi:hypothetical protein